jgi:hypothetical protein
VSARDAAHEEIRRRVLAEAYRYALSIARRETTADFPEKAGGGHAIGKTEGNRQ